MTLSAFGLLTDENIDPQVVETLRSEGFDIFDVKESGLTGSTDIVLMRRAMSERRVILTHDSDFGTLAIAASEPFIGILYLRPGHIKTEFTIGTVRAVLVQNLELTSPFIIVAMRSGDQVRIRVRQP